MDKDIKKYPAPWDLKGKGYIFLYKFNKKFVEQSGKVPEFLKDSFTGGFGSVMLVNYKQSNAGPYGELLFIPGKFKFNNKKLDNISKIYVSTMESVVNGRLNWGIPKEKADFSFEQIDTKIEKVKVSLEGKLIAEFEIKYGRFFFPVSTKLLPFPLVQRFDGKNYFTNFYGKGKGHFAHIRKMKINPDFFPDVSIVKPIAIIRVDPFSITFPKANIEKLS